MKTTTEQQNPVFDTTLASYAASFERFLRASNKSKRTIETYLEALSRLGAFLHAQGMPEQLPSIKREHVEAFMVDLLTRWKPGTANNRYRSLQQFFKWAIEEGEIKESPMARMHPPQVPENPPDVLSPEQIKKMLKMCSGTTFLDRRDTAIILLLVDTGMRRSEIANLTLPDVDFDQNTCKVLAKGRKIKLCPFGKKTALALDRYLRIRSQHPFHHEQWLWLGYAGKLTPNGLYQVVRERAKQAGIGTVYTHLFRHTYAHEWLSAGGNETDLMRLAGWKSRVMLNKYGASAADQRAREAYKNLSPADRL